MKKYVRKYRSLLRTIAQGNSVANEPHTFKIKRILLKYFVIHLFD